MNEECFLKRLVDLKYEKINDNYQTGDIVVFENDGKIMHACYYFCNELFLNKSGQSKFNPIVLLPFKNILNDWSNCKYFIYRNPHGFLETHSSYYTKYPVIYCLSPAFLDVALERIGKPILLEYFDVL
jgi:hypothetical protein